MDETKKKLSTSKSSISSSICYVFFICVCACLCAPNNFWFALIFQIQMIFWNINWVIFFYDTIIHWLEHHYESQSRTKNDEKIDEDATNNENKYDNKKKKVTATIIAHALTDLESN